jgi:3-oxoacyl-[acyl-carrier protein] reductase
MATATATPGGGGGNGIIVVTGASKGIGAGTAQLFGKLGWTVFVHYGGDRRGAEAVAADVTRSGGKAHVIGAELSTEKGCIELFDGVRALTDRVDVLVNNAGVSPGQLFGVREGAWKLYEYVYSTNTFSVAKLSALFLPLLERSDNASIINMTSVAMRCGTGSGDAYAGTKGAIDAMTRFHAAELGPKVRVNSICPGYIETPIQRYTTEERKALCMAITPVKRLGCPEDIAQGVQFLVENKYVTGQSLGIDGGLWMR